MSYRVREARPADVPALDGFRGWPSGRAETGPVALVAVDEDGLLAGFVLAGPAEDHEAVTAEVYVLEVARDHWGCGAGCDLLATAVDRLGRAGFDRAVLWIDALNLGARTFYERHGWSADALDRQVSRAGADQLQARYSRPLA